ncbi:MAG: SDR family NAD(P)-dependent oxidoreductase, partial [Xanthobacteraceae bacterium]
MTVAKLKAQQTAGGRLAGKAAIVTGAARGIGRAVAVDWHDQIDVNLTGTCNAIRAVAPHLVANGGGRIIVTSSTQGRHGTKYGAAYSASKWGIIGLMKSAALEFGEHKITVNALIP